MSHWSNLESDPWFKGPKTTTGHEGPGRAWAQLLIGLAMGGLFFYLGYTTLAYVVWVLGGGIGVVSIASAKMRGQLQAFFAKLGVWLGRGLAALLLTPIFFIGFTGVRILDWMARRDPLQLKGGEHLATFWAPCDHDGRRLPNISRSFVTEPPTPSGSLLVPVLILSAFLFVGGEVMLQAMGYGSPVLYVEHPVVGYLPKANQKLRRLGNDISINEFGMRAPSVSKVKPQDTFRVLMLGDSCLYGGSYVDQENIYARRVARILQAEAGERKVEVLNMGVNAWGPFNKLGFVQTYGNFGADLAIIALPYKDMARTFHTLADVPFLPAANPPTFAYEEVAYHLVWRWRAAKRGAQRDTYEQRRERGIDAYVKLAQTLRAQGTEVMFEVLPSRPGGTSPGPSADEKASVAKLEAAIDNAFKLGFPAKLFADQEGSGPLYHDFVHLDQRGHELYADYFSSRVKTQSSRWQAFVGVSSL